MSTPASRRTDLRALIDASGNVHVNPPMLLQANQYFDLAGEELGRRLLITSDHDGVEYCLRPDFTLPIVSSYLKDGLAGTPVAYSYLGAVFRQRPGGPAEFEQAGLELLGQANPEAALEDVLAFARRALEIYAVTSPEILLGGVGLFEALLAAANMPEVWRPRIRHRFGHPEALARLFDRLADPHGAGTQGPEPVAPAALLERVNEEMFAAGFDSNDGRQPEEVAARYREKAALAAARVPAKTIDLLRRYLSIDGEVLTALDRIEALAGAQGIDLSGRLAVVRRQTARLAELSPKSKITFDAGFSPRLDYYTGVVFEMRGRGGAVLASGGQYDRLLDRLGVAAPITAAGCAVWVDRLEAEIAK